MFLVCLLGDEAKIVIFRKVEPLYFYEINSLQTAHDHMRVGCQAGQMHAQDTGRVPSEFSGHLSL